MGNMISPETTAFMVKTNAEAAQGAEATQAVQAAQAAQAAQAVQTVQAVEAAQAAETAQTVLSKSQTEVQLATTAATAALIATEELKVRVETYKSQVVGYAPTASLEDVIAIKQSTISQTLAAEVQVLPESQTAAQTKVTIAKEIITLAIEAATQAIEKAQLIQSPTIRNERLSTAQTIKANALALLPTITNAEAKLTQMTQLKIYSTQAINQVIQIVQTRINTLIATQVTQAAQAAYPALDAAQAALAAQIIPLSNANQPMILAARALAQSAYEQAIQVTQAAQAVLVIAQAEQQQQQTQQAINTIQIAATAMALAAVAKGEFYAFNQIKVAAAERAAVAAASVRGKSQQEILSIGQTAAQLALRQAVEAVRTAVANSNTTNVLITREQHEIVFIGQTAAQLALTQGATQLQAEQAGLVAAQVKLATVQARQKSNMTHQQLLEANIQFHVALAQAKVTEINVILNTQDFSSSQAAALMQIRNEIQQTINVLWQNLQHSPAPAQAAQAELDIILARPLAVRQSDQIATQNTTLNLAQSGGGQNHEAVLEALENEIRALVVVIAPQFGRRLTPSIIQSIVDAVKTDYSNNNYHNRTPAMIILSATRPKTYDFMVQFAPLITQNFSNTSILEPFWNVTQTRAESVRNAECNNNTLPIGVYLSNNMSMYASIKY